MRSVSGPRKSQAYKIKVPAPCCEGCELWNSIRAKEIQDLHEKVEALETSLACDRSMAWLKLKIQSALELYRHAMSADAMRGYAVTDPVVLTKVFSTAVAAVEKAIGSPRMRTVPEEAEEFKAAVDSARIPIAALSQNGLKPHLGWYENSAKEYTEGVGSAENLGGG